MPTVAGAALGVIGVGDGGGDGDDGHGGFRRKWRHDASCGWLVGGWGGLDAHLLQPATLLRA